MEEYKKLLETAIESRKLSYSPYSHFAVGAALLCSDGTVYTGCNIENAAYSPSICAERVAIFKALSENRRDFKAIAIAGGKSGEDFDGLCPPCGVCRQVLQEFCSPSDFEVILGSSGDNMKVLRLSEIFPFAFMPESIKKQTE
ncbi:MAG: cytidine deaminase [Bacillota bacterium]|nr:cytidine deaminase [Bacillota bacterium]